MKMLGIKQLSPEFILRHADRILIKVPVGFVNQISIGKTYKVPTANRKKPLMVTVFFSRPITKKTVELQLVIRKGRKKR